jgi:hypothetical protein
MSIGNLRDQGNKGNNFPWQLAVLKLLQSVVNNTFGLNPQVKTANVLNTTTTGTVPSGVFSCSIANVGSNPGLVEGQSIPVGTILNFDAGVLNNTLNSISYDATGTIFLITYID